MMDGSRRITVRNRRHLRKIPGKVVVEKEEESQGGEEEEDDDEETEITVLPSAPSVPSTPPAIISTRAKMEDPEPSPVPEPS